MEASVSRFVGYVMDHGSVRGRYRGLPAYLLDGTRRGCVIVDGDEGACNVVTTDAAGAHIRMSVPTNELWRVDPEYADGVCYWVPVDIGGEHERTWPALSYTRECSGSHEYCIASCMLSFAMYHVKRNRESEIDPDLMRKLAWFWEGVQKRGNMMADTPISYEFASVITHGFQNPDFPIRILREFGRELGEII